MTLKLKRDAAEDFTKMLLGSEIGKQVIKVILFGSVAKGEAKEESDIDLLVIASGSLDKVREASADASFQTWLKLHQGVEPLVYCIDSLRFNNSIFLEQALRTGQEVFSMTEEERLREEAKDYLSLAEQYLNSARRNLSEGDLRVAIDVAYNSAELCAKALIFLIKAGIPGSHGGVVNKFGELYVQSGEVSKELGRSLNRHLELRNRARYDPHAEITSEAAKRVIETAEEMIELLADKLR
ncbi:MAG: HEPN domain-containing protein [Deltaproteobacteria bacterium]|nr:HEPN domain-containing protein [Deltaproteobacteria bacterium]